MKKQVQFLVAVALLATSALANAQKVANFDDVSIPTDSFYNGKDQKGSFISGGNTFISKYDTAFGGYWSAGFAVSNKKDSTTSGFGNLYSAYAGSGYKSANYAVGQQNAVIKLDSATAKNTLKGIYVTNATFPALSMKNGDAFAKKFGGTTGNDPDFFLLTIKKYIGGVLSPVPAVDFYLADYRSLDNSKDYIVKDWTFVDLSSLGMADSLQFTLSSTDIGQFGINTPLFFAIDDFNAAKTTTGIRAFNTLNAQVMPNPATDVVNIAIPVNHASVIVRDITGKEVVNILLNQQMNTIDISSLNRGIYVITIQTNEEVFTQKLIKN